MTLLTSIFQRQLVPSPLKRAFPFDFALNTFSCVRDDEYLVQRREIDVPPFACRFSKGGLGGHMLGIADEEGWVQILDSRKTAEKSLIKEWNAHENAVFDIAWMEGEEFLVTASGDQTVRLWDVNRDGCLAMFKGHSCSVKSVDFREDDIFVFASGARDGNVMVWDMRCNRRTGHFCQPVNIIANAHVEKLPGTPQLTKKKTRRSTTSRPVMNSGQQSVTAVSFQGGEKLISTGAMDGSIKIWDLRKTYTNLKADPVPFHIFPYPGQGVRRKHGFSSLVLDSNHSCIFASCTDDNIYMYSCTTLAQEPVCTFSGHLNSTFYVKAALSPDDMYLLSGSSDNDAYIWRVADPTAPPTLLKGHLGEVTSVAWCPSDLGKVITCSDDNSFRIWRMDCRASKGNRHNVIGESCRGTCLRSHSPINDVSSPSRLDRTPSHSPARSPDSKRMLWTPPPKVITNPRLNQISSPIAKMSLKLQSPLNKTPPKMQNLHMETLSPNTSASSPKLKTGLSSQVASNPPPATASDSLPLSPGSQSPQFSNPRSPAVSKFRSPTQLLTSWLRTNSRKRTHSDSDDNTDREVQSLKSEPISEMILKVDNTLQNAEDNKIREHKTKDTIEKNPFSGQKSPAVSPLKKRFCVDDPLNKTTYNKETVHANKSSLSPGKENKPVDNCSPGKPKTAKLKPDAKCKQRSEATSNQCVKTKSSSSNWLTQWSIHCKAKYGGNSISLSEKGCESNTTETVDLTTIDEESPADGLQPQGEDNSKPGQSVLTYFKPVSHS